MALLAVVGVVLGAWYMLQAVERVFFGGSREPPHSHAPERCDLRWHEWTALAPLAVFVIWIGVMPGTFLAPVSAAIRESTAAATQAFTERMESLEPDRQIVVIPR